MSNIRVDIKRQDSTGTTSSSQSDDMGDLSFELAHGPTGSGATGLTPDRSEIIRRKKEEMRRRRQSMSMGVPPSFKDWGSIQSKPASGGRRKTRKHMSRRKNKTKKVVKPRNKTRRHKSRRNKKSKKHTKRRKQRGGGFFDFIFGKKEEEKEQSQQTVSAPQPETQQPAQPVPSAQPETQPTQVVDTPPEAESQ
jgi:hypothetical protein|uniref:Uncharacterized protein n=1 Tax=viral metagenome TaxID=1070528 RepID=A0A6C0IK71_9ZZZZ